LSFVQLPTGLAPHISRMVALEHASELVADAARFNASPRALPLDPVVSVSARKKVLRDMMKEASVAPPPPVTARYVICSLLC